MIAKLSAYFFRAAHRDCGGCLLSLEQAFSVRLSCDRSFRDPCGPGVNLSVLEITKENGHCQQIALPFR